MKRKINLIIALLSVVLMSNAQNITCVTGPAGSSPQQNTITFTAPTTPCGPFISYEIWGAESATGTFSLVQTITNASTLSATHDLPATAGAIWYYYVVYNYNCPGVPAVTSNTATNAFSNANIEIQNIDIQYNPNGIQITWQQSPYSQTVGYNIGLLQANGTVIPLGTSNSISDTTYFDNVGLASEALNYTVSIIDGCGNPSSYNSNGYQQVLWKDINQDRCQQRIHLEWNQWEYPYANAPNLQYNIIVNNGNDTTIAQSQALHATEYSFADFIDGDTLNFRIEVVETDGKIRSTSEWKQIVAGIVQPPSVFLIENLTVNTQNQIEVHYYIDTLAEIRNFKINNDIYDVTKPNNLIEKYDFDIANKSNPHKKYIDSISNPNQNAFYYQVVANDSCNKDHFSTKGRTILTHVTLADFFLNKIEWNKFELDSANVSVYRLYRDYGAGMQLVETFSPNETQYMDNVEAYHQQDGEFCYYVEADFSLTIPNVGTKTYTTRSNTFCKQQRPSVYVPNAIAPNGVNNQFKPVIVFGSPTNYSMQIYNRWGELIFESTNPNDAWNGTKNGQTVVSGGYPYNINFTASDGTPVNKKGIVIVVE